VTTSAFSSHEMHRVNGGKFELATRLCSSSHASGLAMNGRQRTSVYRQVSWHNR